MSFENIVASILEGKFVNEEAKHELFMADASNPDVKNQGLFANVSGHLIMLICKERGIVFEGINLIDLPKLRNAYAYQARFTSRAGAEFNCMCISEIPQVGTGSFQFLAGSIDHLASTEGCSACDYSGGCESCDRTQMTKLAPPGSGLGLKESEAGLISALGQGTYDSLIDLYGSYHEFRRQLQGGAAQNDPTAELPVEMPEPMRQLYMTDLPVIDYALALLRRAARKANDPESATAHKLVDCLHVEDSMNIIQAQLKGFRAFVARVKADPKGMADRFRQQQSEDEPENGSDEDN
ncbi:MAG: hypothetical protein ACOYNP_13105 [Gemmataceae bacterium]